MNVTDITDLNTTNDCDNITDLKASNDYNNCTDYENNIDIIIPTLLLTVPCGLSFLCLVRLMVYIFIKPLITNK